MTASKPRAPQAGTGTFDATGNWWGNANGPYNATSNPSGAGDAVADSIAYSPWLGIGTDTSVAVGFQPASPMTFVARTQVCLAVGCVQQGINLASAGDTINIQAGTYTETDTVNKNLTFVGLSTPGIQNLAVNTGNVLTVGGDIQVNSALTLNGDISTGANTVVLASGSTVAGAGDVIGNTRRDGAFAVGSYAFNSGTTLINFSSVTTSPTSIVFNLVKSKPGDLTTAVPRTYTITAAGSPVFSAAVQFHYKTSEGGFAVEANTLPWKKISGTWTAQAGSDTAAGDASYVIATSVTGFSQWALTDNGHPTAVKLSNFSAGVPNDNLVYGILALFGAIGLVGGAYQLRRK